MRREIGANHMQLLTDAQQTMWYAHQLNPEHTNFITAEYVTFKGDIQLGVLRLAFEKTLAQVESLQQQFVERDGKVYQQTVPRDIHIPVIHTTDAIAWMKQRLTAPLHIENGILFEAAFVCNDNTHDVHFFFKVHHIAIDAFGYQLIYRAAAQQYEALLEERELLSVFGDYDRVVAEQLAYTKHEQYAQDKQFWQQYLRLDDELATFSQRPVTLDGHVHQAVTDFKAEDVQRWQQRSFAEKLMPQHYLMAAFACLTYKVTHKTSVVINVPFMNRFGHAAATVPCLQMNTVPLQIELSPTMTLIDVAKLIQREEARIKQHSLYRFEHIRRDAGFAYDERICTGQFNFMPFYEVLTFGCAQAETHKLSIGVIDDLSFNVFATATGMRCELLGNSAIYDEQTLSTWLSYYTTILHEQQMPLYRYLQTDVMALAPFVSQPDILTQIQRQVRIQPEKIAIQSEQYAVTYAQLDEESDRIAYWLCQQGVQPGDDVALYLPRTPKLIACMIAVLKIRATYIPLDPVYPLERIQYIVQDAQAKVLLCEGDVALDVTQLNVTPSPWQHSPRYEDVALVASDIAYKIYTSGSTGNPKGVVVGRAQLSNFLIGMQDVLPVSDATSLLAVTTNAFDISMLECFLPLTVGGKVVLSTASEVHDPLALKMLIDQYHISMIQATPSLWKMLVDYIPASLHNVVALVGGEALPERLAQKMLAHTQLMFNMYGPTETTIWSTVALIKEATAITLGQPIAQTAIYILDDDLQPVLPGTEGHLYIAGAGVAQGYDNRPALTASRFIANPFTNDGTRMYQTGDVVKMVDGQLHYIGRTDFQVKIRGFRIELQEIERALTAIQGVQEALVLAQKINDTDQLVAYVMSAHAIDVDKYTMLLEKTLPAYMIPTYWVAMDKWPMTNNGKIDRKALPMPALSTAGAALSTKTEVQLAKLYEEILNLSAVDADSHFFRLGGHSLLATALMMRIRDIWRCDITIATIFAAPTVRTLAKAIDDAQSTAIWPVLEQVPSSAYVPLSATQKGMWFMQHTQPSATYNIPLIIENVSLDEVRLVQALAILQQQHPILRTVYELVDGVPMQRYTDQQIPIIHSSRENIDDDAHTLFDLATELSVKVFIYDDTIQFLWHHIAIDGYGLSVFLKDFAFAYEQLKPRTEPLSYASYVEWQRKLLETPYATKGLDYWGQQLKDVPTEITLPGEASSTEVAGDYEWYTLKPETFHTLQRIAQAQGVSLYTVLQTAFSIVLHKMGAGDDITIGSPTNGRPIAPLQQMIGLMMNTVVYRYQFTPGETIAEAITATHQMNEKAYAYDFVPFDRVVERVNPDRTSAKNPLFDVMMTMQNNPELALTLDGRTLPVRLMPTATSKVSLAVEVMKDAQTLKMLTSYDPSKFSKKIIVQLMARFEQVIQQMQNGAQCIEDVSLLLSGEYEALRTQSTPQPAQFTPMTIVERFEAVAMKHASRIAIVDGEKRYTYAALNERANQLARHLKAQGVECHDHMALLLSRQYDMLVSLLAILKVGATYVPIDPQYPEERVAYILQSAKPILTIVETTPTAQQIALDDIPYAQYMATNLDKCVVPEDPAYIIYTSGSTGKPKGVVIPHSNVLRLLDATAHWYQFNENDCWTFFHSYAFDFSIWEIWGALLTGGKLVIVPYEVSRTPSEFHALLISENVTVLNQTPSAFYQLLIADATASRRLQLRYIIFGGEALSFERIRPWYDKYGETTTLVNMYGITETTVHVSYQRLNRDIVQQKQASLIGEAIPDLEIYVLDAALRPVPAGVIGEMYVAGDGLAHGYLGRPALTAERFIANPFKQDGSRMYRTGDLAKWTTDGNLAYIGRIDHQVKIRGFRIELDEIESALLQLPYVHEAIAVTKQYSDDDVRMIAYVVADEWDVQQATKHLATLLPNYMMPNAYVALEEMPLTPNGKLDIKALPQPQFATSEDHPTNPTEEVMLQLFRETLQNDALGIHDSFFEVGGHSLLAVQLMTKIKQTFDVTLSIGHLFEAPSVSKICANLTTFDEQHSLQTLLPLRPNASEQPLFCVHPAGGLSWCYAGFMQHLAPEQALYGLQAVGIAEEVTRPNTLTEMAKGYVDALRNVQPKGPYTLLGWSLGGNVVQEMACQLEAAHECVTLIILDAYPVHHQLGDQTLEEEAVEALLALGGLDVELIEGEMTLDNVIALLKKEGSALASLSVDTLQRLLKTYMNSITLLRAHEPRRCEAEVMFYQSTILPEWFEKVDPMIWQPYVGTLHIEEVACRHKDMCQPVPIRTIGQHLAQFLQQKGKMIHV